MYTLDILLAVFQSYFSLICFFGAFIAGGETVFFLALLSAQDSHLPITVFFFCSLGIFCADLLWFYVGRLRRAIPLKKEGFVRATHDRIHNLIQKSSSPLPSLLIAKITYGIGIPLMIYWGRKKLALSTFLKYNSLIILIWSSVLVLTGWLVGKGFNRIYDLYKDIKLALFILVISVIVIHVFDYFLGKWLSKKFSSSKNISKFVIVLLLYIIYSLY